MWIIASIPFWIIGALFSALGLACTVVLLWKFREMNTEKAAEGMQNAVALLAIGGGALLIAAKVAL